jgi:hypothetical protein
MEDYGSADRAGIKVGVAVGVEVEIRVKVAVGVEVAGRGRGRESRSRSRSSRAPATRSALDTGPARGTHTLEGERIPLQARSNYRGAR